MGRESPVLLSFNAGELSPLMEGRIDVEKYNSGCRTMQNFLPQVQGGASKRSGFRHVRRTQIMDNRSTLIPFNFSTTQAYVLEFTDQRMYVMKDGGSVLDAAGIPVGSGGVTNTTPIAIDTNPVGHGFVTDDLVFVQGTGIAAIDLQFFRVTVTSPTSFTLNGTTASGTSAVGTVTEAYSISTPYTEDELHLISFAQSADVLYLAHPNHPPMKLSRFDHNDWLLEEIGFDYFPFATENSDENDFMCANASTGSVTLTSTGGHFESSMVGTYVKIREILEAFAPEWKPETSFDGGAYAAFQASPPNFSTGDRCFNEGRVYQLTNTHGGSATGTVAPVHDSGYASDGRWDWQFINYGYGYALITAVNDAYRAVATVIKTFPKSVVSPDKSVSSMTTANPSVVTVTAHGWETGDKVLFHGVTGTFGTAVNNTVFTITRITNNTFSVPLNGTGLAGGVGSSVRVDVGVNANGISAIYPSLWRWSFGAWSDHHGYPKSVTFFEDRLLWAGTSTNPQSIWFSRTGRYEDYRETDESDSAMMITLNSATVDSVEWIAAQDVLHIGTTEGEWSPSKSDDPLQPSNIAARIKRRSAYGSRPAVLPSTIENVVMFAVNSGRKLRELVYNDTSAGYIANDMTVLSEHVADGLLKETAFQGDPDRILWALMENGELWGMTYERDQQVGAWHRHVLGGTNVTVESIAVIPHPAGDRDQLWAVVKRDVPGFTSTGDVRFIEYMEVPFLRTDVIEDAFFVDSGLSYSGAPASVFSGLRHLRGESLSVLADGVYIGDFTVSATDTITIPNAASNVHIGYSYMGILEPMKIEAGGQDGPAIGKTKRIHQVLVRLYRTGKGLYFGPTEDRATVEIVDMEDGLSMQDGELFTGDSRPQPFPGGYSRAGRVVLKHTTPLPCTILAMSPRVSTQDG